MSKILEDNEIKESGKISDYRNLIKCHNAWVSLYKYFMKDPVLSAFYDVAKQNEPLASLQDSRIFLMKHSIALMVEHIKKNFSTVVEVMPEIMKGIKEVSLNPKYYGESTFHQLVKAGISVRWMDDDESSCNGPITLILNEYKEMSD